MNHRMWAGVVFLLCAAVGRRATASSDPAMFLVPADRGGGGGRMFTGSSADPFSCSVCHRDRSSEPIALELEGLDASYSPGELRRVHLRWDSTRGSHALNLELLDAEGRSPRVYLDEPESLAAASRCDGAIDGVPAVEVVELGERRVITVMDCGASEVVVHWVAPESAAVHLSAGVVRSDGSATSDGDAVRELRRSLWRRGHAEPADDSGCRARGGMAGPGLVWLIASGLVGRRHRRFNDVGR